MQCIECSEPTKTRSRRCVVHARIRQSAMAEARKAKRVASGLCKKCGRTKPLEGKRFCLPCNEKHKVQSRTQKRRTWLRVIAGYGGKCVCCGEANPLFLTLDHVNGDGTKHRRELVWKARTFKHKPGTFPSTMHFWVLKNGFPPILQLMCFNCNCGRARNGGICPHRVGAAALS